MARYKRLNRLCIELDSNEISSLQARLLYRSLQLSLLRIMNLRIRNFSRAYPISYKDLLKLIVIKRTDTTLFIGILPDSLKGSNKDKYRKIYEVEFGVNGIEQRVLRRALEECFINL